MYNFTANYGKILKVSYNVSSENILSYQNHISAIQFMKQYGFIPNMLEKVGLTEGFTILGGCFYFTPGKTADAKALGKMIDKLPSESSIYGDSAYLDYKLDDNALHRKTILLKIQRKLNSKRTDDLEQKLEKLKMGKRVETTISDIKKLFSRAIHIVTLKGFLIKLTLFVFGLQSTKAMN